jgi:hypothetical protein
VRPTANERSSPRRELPLRQTEGFVRSLIALMQLDLTVPVIRRTMKTSGFRWLTRPSLSLMQHTAICHWDSPLRQARATRQEAICRKFDKRLRARSETRDGRLQMAFFCAAVLAYFISAPLRCSKIAIFAAS